MPKKKIVWLYTDWASNEFRSKNDLYGAISYYRVIKPVQYLKKYYDIEAVGAKFKHWGTSDETYRRLGKYDLILSKHVSDGETASNILATADHFGKKVVVDMDDNYLDIRKSNPAYDVYAKLKGTRYFLGAFLELSDGLITSTEPLKETYAPLNYAKPDHRIDVLPNCNDVNDWKFPIKKWEDGKIRIGYAGGTSHNDDLELIYEPIANILDKYPNVLFEICGAFGKESIMGVLKKIQSFSERDITDQVNFFAATPAWEGFPKFLCSFGWDIGLAPLIQDPFNDSKSHIKWFDYSMIGIPTIASHVYPYYKEINGVKTIVEGDTGFFADSAQEWFDKMEDLINVPQKRKKVARNAYLYIKKHWQFRHWIHLWKEVIDKYLE